MDPERPCASLGTHAHTQGRQPWEGTGRCPRALPRAAPPQVRQKRSTSPQQQRRSALPRRSRPAAAAARPSRPSVARRRGLAAGSRAESAFRAHPPAAPVAGPPIPLARARVPLAESARVKDLALVRTWPHGLDQACVDNFVRLGKALQGDERLAGQDVGLCVPTARLCMVRVVRPGWDTWGAVAALGRTDARPGSMRTARSASVSAA